MVEKKVIAGVKQPVERFERVLKAKARGFERVVAWSITEFHFDRLDSSDFNIIVVFTADQENWLIEKLAAWYAMKGPRFKIDETKNDEISKDLFINHIADRTVVAQFSHLSNPRQLGHRFDLEQYAFEQIIKRNLLPG